MIIKYDQEPMQALIKLGNDFPSLNWNFSQLEEYQNNENTSHWPGEKDENVMICIFKGNNINEQFHRQDFFFLHFAYDGNYEALSSQHNNRIVMNEGDYLHWSAISWLWGKKGWKRRMYYYWRSN